MRMTPQSHKVTKQTKAPHRKSRLGCSRCKTLKTKCDEKKPSCSRCEARGVPCSGYDVNLRWSYKHEVQQQQSGSQEQGPAATDHNSSYPERIPEPESVAPSAHSSSVSDAQGVSDSASTVFPDIHNYPHSSVPVFGQWNLSPHLGAQFLEGNGNQDPAIDLLLLHNEELDWSSLPLPPLPGHVEDISESSIPTAAGPGNLEDGPGDDTNDPGRGQASDILGPGRLRDISDLSSSLSTYFFRDVISSYCTWDSNFNIMRIIIDAMWQSSGALYHTMQSMAASCLSNELPHLTKVAEQERLLALQLVQETPMREDRLLAAFFLGHTSCWVNPTDLVPDQFKEVWTTLASYASSAVTTVTISFVQEALEYWTMMLTFITDTEQLGISAARPPEPAGPRPLNSLITPNPFSGISRGAVSIFTDTGRLIYKLRKRLPKLRFLREDDLNFFRDALNKANQLERRILVYNPVDASRMVVLGDPQTTPEHFKILDEAFRYTSLLQLYRLFPDLLQRRYRPWNPQEILLPQSASTVPSQVEMDDWLTQLALHILNMLQEIPVESRTRSIQPPILVAVSSELRYSSASTTTTQDGGPETSDVASVTLPDISHSINIVRARRFVMTRLSIYWHVLPLLKIKKYQALVNRVWEAMDAGIPDVYWADMLWDEQLRTIMG